MARLRSASECSLESVESDSDGGFKPGQSGAECSDTESDIEMEVSILLNMRTHIHGVTPYTMIRGTRGYYHNVQGVRSPPHVKQFGWRFDCHPQAGSVATPLPLS